MYPLMFPNTVHAQLVESADWALYKASLVEDTCVFDIHHWWDSIKEWLPTMYPYLLGEFLICQYGGFWHFLGIFAGFASMCASEGGELKKNMFWKVFR